MPDDFKGFLIGVGFGFLLGLLLAWNFAVGL